MMVTSEILKRTFLIRNGSAIATAFTMDREGRRYLISAGHIIKNEQERIDVLEVFFNNDWMKIKVTEVGERRRDVDVVVWAPQPAIGPCIRLETAREIILGEDIWFLGFLVGEDKEQKRSSSPPWLELNPPLEFNAGYPIPFVRKGCMGGFTGRAGMPIKIFIDGINRPGLSGGPIVTFKNNVTKVIGLVSGYYPDQEIMVGEYIDSVIERIKLDPKGTIERVCENTDSCCPGRNI